MSDRHTISIDVGTTNLKMSRFNEQLDFEEDWSYHYQNIYSTDLIYELNWSEMREAILTGLKQLQPGSEYRIVLTTAMHSILLRDKEGHDLTGIITWADKRGHQEMMQLDAGFKQDLYQLTGTPVHSMNPFYKLYFWCQNPIWKKVERVCSIKDLIFELLTGEWWIDVSNASSSGFYESIKGQWSGLALEKLQLAVDQLPIVKACDSKVPLLKTLELGQGSVIIGTSDGVSSNYVYRSLSNYAVLSFGTSHAVRILSDRLKVESDSMNFSYQIKDGEYLVGYPSNNAGNVLDWICQVYQTDFKEIEQIVLTCKNEDIVFLPFLNGERAPLWDEQAVSKLIGVQRHHARVDLIYAMICGVFFNVRQNVENLRSLHDFEGVALTGGLAHSKVLVQLLANLIGVPVLVPSDHSAERLGTIILVDDLKIPIAFDQVVPKQDSRKVFDRWFRIYQSQLNK